MKKKLYEKPALQVVELQQQSSLLAGSGKVVENYMITTLENDGNKLFELEDDGFESYDIDR